MKLQFDERIGIGSVYGIHDTDRLEIIPGVKKYFYGAKHIEDLENLDNCVHGILYRIDNTSEYPYMLSISEDKILIEECRYIVDAWVKTENMSVREFIETNRNNLIGYKIRFEDFDEYEHFCINMTAETNLDNIKDSLCQQLLDDLLIDIIDIYNDEEDIYGKQIMLQSRCEL